MVEIIFKIAFGLLFVIYILIRAPFDKRYRKIEKKKVVQRTVEGLLLVLLSIGLLVIPLIWEVTPLLDACNIFLPVWIRFVGVVVAVSSLFYFWWIHTVLGNN
jgi:hypothetical protein